MWKNFTDAFYLNFISDDRWHYIADGLKTTLIITFFACMMGIVLGFIVGMIRSTHDKTGNLKLLNILCKIYLTVIRGTPVVVQLLIIYFVVFGSTRIDKVPVAIMAFGINSGAYVAEIFRSGIMSIDPGQMEGAKAIGMTHVQAMLKVILPQAFRNIIPQIGNNFIINIKDTSVLSVISIVDLFFVHKSVAGALYTYFESATIVMCIYLTMTLVSSRLLALWERKLDGDDNYELVDVMDIGNQMRVSGRGRA